MANYTVVRDFYVAEFDVQLQPGQAFADGDAEPDLVAQLLAHGVIVDANANVGTIITEEEAAALPEAEIEVIETDEDEE